MSRLVSDAEVTKHLAWNDALNAVERAHLSLQRGTSDNVVRTRARSAHMSLHSLSAISDELSLGATKVYSATRNGVRSFLLLFDLASGDLVATFEANELGRRRTVAASVLAASLFHPDPPKTICLFGAGFQAEGVVDALANHDTFSKASLNIVSRSADSAKALAKALVDSPLDAHACNNSNEALDGASLIFTATTSSKPLFDYTETASAKCICALGSNSLARRELSPRVVTAAKRVVVDSIDVAKAEAGDLLSPVENGKLRWSQVKELGECLESKGCFEPTKNGFTLFCSQGLALQDLYTAAHVYKHLWQ